MLSRLRARSCLAVGKRCGALPGPSGVASLCSLQGLNALASAPLSGTGGRVATPSPLVLLAWTGSGDVGYRPAQCMRLCLARFPTQK